MPLHLIYTSIITSLFLMLIKLSLNGCVVLSKLSQCACCCKNKWETNVLQHRQSILNTWQVLLAKWSKTYHGFLVIMSIDWSMNYDDDKVARRCIRTSLCRTAPSCFVTLLAKIIRVTNFVSFWLHSCLLCKASDETC